jgi:hypothetical protein
VAAETNGTGRQVRTGGIGDGIRFGVSAFAVLGAGYVVTAAISSAMGSGDVAWLFAVIGVLEQAALVGLGFLAGTRRSVAGGIGIIAGFAVWYAMLLDPAVLRSFSG